MHELREFEFDKNIYKDAEENSDMMSSIHREDITLDDTVLKDGK